MRLLILGAGGYGRTVAEAAELAGGFDRVGFLDDASANALGPCGDYARWTGEFTHAYAAFGDCRLRAEWLGRLAEAGYALPVIVHPRAYVSPSAHLEDGAVVLALAAVGANARVERGGIVNMSSVVDHDAVVGDCAHVAPGAIVKAGARVAPRTKLESGCVAART